jgi:hypothetical protein
MRWLYPIPTTATEERARRAAVDAIDQWWADFAKQADQIDDAYNRQSVDEGFDLVAFMHKSLNAQFPGLCWEFGPALHKDGHRLVITPESEKTLRPLVRTLIDRAPVLPRWEFHDARPPESVDIAEAHVNGRVGGSIAGGTAAVTLGRHRRIDLRFHLPGSRGTDDQDASNRAFIAAEILLGEAVLDQWIGVVEARPPPSRGIASLFRREKGPTPFPLDRLRPTVMGLIESLQEQLPKEPRWRQAPPKGAQTQWSVFEMRPDERPDYPGWSDLYVGVTPDVELFSATHESPAFYSGRFSRAGETFCYLKIDGRNGLEGTPYSDRHDIEDALDAALVPQGLGCVVGGGTGRIYSYIDLALGDLPRAIEVIRRVLRDGQIATRTWLLFFDCELGDEWVGIWDETPPPPANVD